MDLEGALIFGMGVVEEAGRAIQAVRRSGFIELDYKADNSPVTKADHLSEEIIRDRLLGRFPDTGFCGEERDAQNPGAPFLWYCDPLCGTSSFIRYENTIAISLALVNEGKTVLGIVHNPFTGESWYAADGTRPVYNKGTMPSQSPEKCSEAICNYGVPSDDYDTVRKLMELRHEEKLGKLVSPGGSAGLALAQVAQGVYSILFVNSAKNGKPADLAAGIYLVDKVGGITTQTDGSDFDIFGGPTTVLSVNNRKLHEDALNVLCG
ncbi:MAG: inositol monophosphatase family protein [Candidatus Woesearchaeota archaeon]|jgi:fructose-1,6-bisphosphatase/inositol monophosphatase family enzyme|nr:inositol monophosphatase family protein [Candidatus Woesearchaeota archaeon]MDP7198493.1 inositol monophosphatase family protein [Candidatus Woesearchaeota archaeon]MDP7466765.1 inositol monophosphatase family protein [Candidatus Woesearchaeota archaeon]MDP7647990.1 inositol monophosphatase family protein [Candidatus Woesearchaeota archaeon]